MAVSDGDQAIAAVDQRTPDIVLADVGMPGRDGYEVAQHIKNTPRLAHIPVVLLTGAFEPIDQARAAAVGCDGVLAKPFEPQLVIGRVKELLARRPSAPVRAEPLASPELPAPAQPKTHRLVNEEYFEELDQAFATLTAVPKSPARDRAAEDISSDAIDWFSRPAPAPARRAGTCRSRPAAARSGCARAAVRPGRPNPACACGVPAAGRCVHGAARGRAEVTCCARGARVARGRSAGDRALRPRRPGHAPRARADVGSNRS